MGFEIGRNRNINDTASVLSPITINATTATQLVGANPDRMYLRINVLPGAASVCVFIRLYPFDDDNLMRGDWIGRYNAGNDVFFNPFWQMTSDNIYTGAVSAILFTGDADESIYVTEY